MEYGGTTSAEGILFRSHNPSLVLPFIDLSPGGKGENKRAKNAGDQNPPGFHQGTSSGFLHSTPSRSLILRAIRSFPRSGNRLQLDYRTASGQSKELIAPLWINRTEKVSDCFSIEKIPPRVLSNTERQVLVQSLLFLPPPDDPLGQAGWPLTKKD
jgi:hypothetical protein